MNEEEKKAIKIVEDIAFIRGIRQDVDGELEDLKAIEDVLRLVDKQQREIEEKTTIIMAGAEKVKGLEKEIEELNAEILELINQRTEGFWENDRLKKEIETLKETHKEILKLHQMLKAEDTLLGTDNILNAIEKKYISKDKIKGKIKELEEMELTKGDIFFKMRNFAIVILRELLEE